MTPAATHYLLSRAGAMEGWAARDWDLADLKRQHGEPVCCNACLPHFLHV